MLAIGAMVTMETRHQRPNDRKFETSFLAECFSFALNSVHIQCLLKIHALSANFSACLEFAAVQTECIKFQLAFVAVVTYAFSCLDFIRPAEVLVSVSFV